MADIIRFTACGQDFALTKEEVEQKCAKGARITEEEFFRFANLCKNNSLNPYTDVYIIKSDYRTCIMIGKDGYFRMADRNPNYDGMEDGVIVQNPDGTTEYVNGCLVKKGQLLIGGWARVYRKDRRIPKFASVMLSEYMGAERSLWSKKPSMMINKVAKCIALRESFPTTFSGTYDETEISDLNSYKGDSQKPNTSNTSYGARSQVKSQTPTQTKQQSVVQGRYQTNTSNLQEQAKPQAIVQDESVKHDLKQATQKQVETQKVEVTSTNNEDATPSSNLQTTPSMSLEQAINHTILKGREGIQGRKMVDILKESAKGRKLVELYATNSSGNLNALDVLAAKVLLEAYPTNNS